MPIDVRVDALFQGQRIRCISKCFLNKITRHAYALVLNPIIEVNDEVKTIIPLIFDPELPKQTPTYITDEEDKMVVQGVVDLNTHRFLYEPDNGITFEVIINKVQNNTISGIPKRLPLPDGNPSNQEQIDEVIRRLDQKLVEIYWEEILDELNNCGDDTSKVRIVNSFIHKLLDNETALANISVDFIDDAPSAIRAALTDDDRSLSYSFACLIQSLGMTNVVKQDIISSLCGMVKCKQCTKELYEEITTNSFYSDKLSRDIRQDIHNSVVLAQPNFFDNRDIKTAANYYYSKKANASAISLFNVLVVRLLVTPEANRELAETYNSLGCCYVDILDFEKAYASFSKATVAVKDYAPAYNNWAYTLLIESETVTNKQKRTKILRDALDNINDAIQHSPGDVSYYSNRAYIYFESGNYDRVLRDLEHIRGLSQKYEDYSTALKLSIEARIKKALSTQGDGEIEFSELKNDLVLIWQNEHNRSKYYYEALRVYNGTNDESEDALREITNALLLFEFYVTELLSSMAIHNPQQDIYYYTSMSSLQRVLSDEDEPMHYRLPLFNVNHMNDPREGKEFENSLLSVLGSTHMLEAFLNKNRSATSGRKRLDTDFVFLKSFTKNADSLPMWVHYADTGKGCCVKVSRNFFTNFTSDLSGEDKTLSPNTFDNEYRLYSILYVHDGKLLKPNIGIIADNYNNVMKYFKKVNEAYDKLKEDTKALVLDAVKVITRKLRYLIKSADYSYEEEMRIVVYRPASNMKRDDNDIQITPISEKYPVPKLYVYTTKSVPIEEIIFGPKVTETDDMIPYFAKKLLDQHNYVEEEVLITMSEIEYR